MSPSTATSSSRGVPPRSRSRTAPPTRCTPPLGGAASSSAAPHGMARRVSRRSVTGNAPSTIRWPCPPAAARGCGGRGRRGGGSAPGRCRCRRGRHEIRRGRRLQPGRRVRGHDGDPGPPDPVEPPEEPGEPAPSVRRRLQLAVLRQPKSRTHYLPVRTALRPPFREAWSVTGRVLLEFTPVICGRRLFLLKNNGALYAISRLDGRVRVDAQARVARGRVARLRRRHRVRDAAAALPRLQGRARGRRSTRSTGAPAGRASCPAASESSPLVDSGRLYFGSEDGTVYSLRTSDGQVRWRTRRRARSRARWRSPTASCSSATTAARSTRSAQADGGKVWEKGSGGGGSGSAAGNFYSSAAVAYGRVYIGSTTAPCTRSRRRTARSPGASHRRLRLRLARRRPGAGRTADGLHRLLRRALLRARRADRARRAGRATWAARSPGGEPHRRPRLRLRPRDEDVLGARRGQRARRSGRRGAAPSTR